MTGRFSLKFCRYPLARWGITTIAVLGVLISVGKAGAQDMTAFRIGTGGSGGTYYPIGRMVAEGISHQSLAQHCPDEDCPPQILAVAQTSNGSVANIRALTEGTLEAAFAQANIVHWSYSGAGLFDGQEGQTDLRSIANLFPEAIHFVASADSNIHSISDISGHRVSLDEPGSGTLVDAEYLLQYFGIQQTDFRPEYMKAGLAIERLRSGMLDAFFAVAGAPLRSLSPSDGLEPDDFRIVPITGPEARALKTAQPFYTSLTIPAGVYAGQPDIETLGVGAQFVTHARLSDDVIYEVTRLLWSESTGSLLRTGHEMGEAIVLSNALVGLSIPLHPGAARFYREHGLID